MKHIKAIQIASYLLVALLSLTGQGLASEESFLEHRLELGYRGISTENNPNRAREYDSLESSANGSVEIQTGKGQSHIFLDAEFLNENDYDGELNLSYKGLLRLNLLGTSLHHNLDHQPYDPALPESRQPAVTNNPVNTLIDFIDNHPGADYGIQVEQLGAKFRGKHPGVPAHLNVSYWRMERSGDQQLRYVQEGSPCSTCHVISQTRPVDRVTEEITAGFDSHLGPVDLIYEFMVREFRDRDPIPQDNFPTGILGQRDQGFFQHDELPDSRIYTHTVKAHTSLSGGLIGAASYTIGARENQSELFDVQGVKSETDIQKFAGDLTWIANGKLTVNARYRYLDLDNDNSDALTVAGFVNPAMAPLNQVRDNIDIIRANSELAVTYRPYRKLSLKAEFKREDIHRSNTGEPVDTQLLPIFFGVFSIDPVWELPEDEIINRYRLSFFHRPLDKGRLKVRGHVQYQTSNDPAYGTAFEEGYKAFVGANWTPAPTFGLLTNLRAERTDNEHTLNQFDGTTVVGTIRDRETQSENLTAGIWYNPVEKASITLNYGYLRSRILQDTVIGNDPDLASPTNAPWILAENTEFAQRVQTVNLGVQWRLLDNLKALAEGRYIRSYSSFDPQFAKDISYRDILPDPVSIDSSDLRQISKVDIRQSGGSLGLEWSPEKSLTCSATYTYDRYDDLDQELFDGSVQTYMASLSKSW